MQKYDLAAVHAAATEYKHKAKVLRQIHSRKLSVAAKRKMWLDIVTIFVSLIMSFLAFFGVDRIHAAVPTLITMDALNLVFNVFVLLILIVSVMQLVTRLSDSVQNNLVSVKTLTDFIVDMDDTLRIGSASPDECESMIESMNRNYKSACHALPASGDGDWKRAKRELKKKAKE